MLITAIKSIWDSRSRRPREDGFEFVYVNQDGSVREVSPDEKAYLSEKFPAADGGRPYIKASYGSRDGWGSQSGFIPRRRVPPGIPVTPVHPRYDSRVNQLETDILGPHRAAGDIIETHPDGSVSCTPNPNVSGKERFELSRDYMLEKQRCREILASADEDT